MDVIFATPLIRTGMEIPSVLIPFNRSTNFGSMFPDQELSVRYPRKDRGDDGAQAVLSNRQDPILLNVVE
jgi:hypothetical protein